MSFIVPTHSSWIAGVTVRTRMADPKKRRSWTDLDALKHNWKEPERYPAIRLWSFFFFLNCALFRAKLEKASSNSYRRLQGVSGIGVKRAVVLNCS